MVRVWGRGSGSRGGAVALRRGWGLRLDGGVGAAMARGRQGKGRGGGGSGGWRRRRCLAAPGAAEQRRWPRGATGRRRRDALPLIW